MNIVEIRNVVKKFNERLVVDHLQATIEQGEIFGLLGPNGAGKSTTIHMLSGLLPIDAGEIKVNGYSVTSQTMEVKRRIGLVPQDLAIYEQMTARDNVTFFAKLYGLRGKQLQAGVDEALEQVGLSDRQGDRPESFSGGMKRRLNIACAIAHRPMLIIMDEPTVGIDPHSRNHILESVRQLNESGSTIIYTSHYMEEVEAICTRVGIMNEGRLIACGTQQQLKEEIGQDDKLRIHVKTMADSNPASAVEECKRHPRIKQAVWEQNTLELLLPSADASLQDILFILSKHGLAVQSLEREQPNLERLFMSLTGRQLRD
ncbi:ABC transporter ATP-binding protein [Paenibacillus thiaminolyticus]|uniref:ABC transporter ATP-binding protein n=1 Tax=Paenibacillus thiaminolyticus TaxID=49283 RepID=A0AAP9DSV7_PANTH|nr:ABC transporter ATP-binding protein [Paenibacillus thiaminolyticus]MCY9533522.1 ABC transporter ATP-binding protein [Paenibacillus thiaminolyticus]MCY9604187.1 ABC transporter ATP-binding protein [Paenibacillus thiaminolyticus]MCY9606265.1 ABC transporter ATP-binding protein [Paenibacillus thiaminolyticus]MCY9612015.1 ABC transporter ATP-binding protein [Paenibacillus thiaminolyticus]MCY9618036.1 ABC transporter ATP-binding protein [Paenibacillus thiaminolyticus]